VLFFVGVKRGFNVSDSRVLRRLFGPKRDEVRRDWRERRGECRERQRED
jgi:hypothetical protein